VPTADTSSNYISVTGGLAGSQLNAQMRFYGKSVSNTGATYETARISGGSTSSSYSLSGGLVFYTSENNGSNVLTLSERMRITDVGQTYTNQIVPQTISPFTSRKNGASIEFGHSNNGSGYYGTLGAWGSSGYPYIGFSADCEDSANTFTTRGFKGNLISGNNVGDLIFYQLTNASITGQTPTERMRIDSNGNLLVATTTNPMPFQQGKLTLDTGSGSYNGIAVSELGLGFTAYSTRPSAAHQYYAGYFLDSGGSAVGSISVGTTSTTYNTSSDYRLKENITDADDAGSKIDAIQVRQFDWIADGSHQDYGMIAQELQTVAPEAVSSHPDGDEMMGVDYSKLVPMLIKEVQSLRARVAELENN